MDKGLITLFVVVGIALAMFVAVVTWVYWSELMAAHRWSQVRKAHRLPKDNLNTGKSSMLGSRGKSKNS